MMAVRGITKAFVLAIALATAQLATTASARADDLPAQLIAAARLFPASQEGRLVCMTISGLANDLRTPAVVADQRTAVAGSAGYSAGTQGTYLGDGPLGAPAPPFVQALLDAGAATRLTLTWTQHTHLPTMMVPQLQDTGTSRSVTRAPAQAPFIDRDTSVQGDAYLVTGADRTLFADDRSSYIALVPPAVAVAAGTEPAHDGPNTGTPPPGIWPTTRVCYTLVPDRVLEYGDVVDRGNGILQVNAAILFRPEQVPTWVSDPRVVDTLLPNMKPVDIRVATFRNDGDGWRPVVLNMPALTGRIHIVGSAP